MSPACSGSRSARCCCIDCGRVSVGLVTGAGVSVLAAGLSVDALLERPIYTFRRSRTEPSLTALLVTPRS